MFRRIWMPWTTGEKIAVPVIIGVAFVIMCAGLEIVMLARTAGVA